MMMKAFIWNIRSVRTQQAFHRLQMLHRHHKFTFIALMEPFQQARNVEIYKRKIGMNIAGANSKGKIWYFIEANVDVQVLSDTTQQISLKIVLLDQNKSLVITLVYVKCNESKRLQLWDDIYQVADSINLPWLVGGDFNVVLHEDEKIGVIPIQPQDYEDFAFCVNSCELMETSFKGSHFTWWNGRRGSNCIFERFDRVFINQQFQQWFAQIEVEHLTRTGFLSIVRDNWSSNLDRNPFMLFKQKLKHTKKILSAWSKEVYGEIFKQLIIREEIVRIKEELFEEDPSPLNIMVLQQALAELKKYLHFEEEFWRQKANEDNELLVAAPNADEVKQAVFALNGDNVLNVVKDFYKGHTLPKSITHTNLVLLPKKQDVQTYANMRPINLSNFINKVILRVVHGRLEGILPRLVSPNQSSFVKGRSIIENVLLTQEIVTDIKKRGKPANVIIKLDMAKAYDRVSWLFFIIILKKMGFLSFCG
ncbi:uncharacterized protein LOC132044942 [Lycium ferocissimum]|uniref:uncharacterized protein LOC132044942 n=1 Tax=Lycium ferocissimum TaxID=112874 RepID=UPI00281666D1|nr:uncharacterized protein LOC132044942 [Lycium ferocissimum]